MAGYEGERRCGEIKKLMFYAPSRRGVALSSVEFNLSRFLTAG